MAQNKAKIKSAKTAGKPRLRLHFLLQRPRRLQQISPTSVYSAKLTEAQQDTMFKWLEQTPAIYDINHAKMNTSKSLQMSYISYKQLGINKNGCCTCLQIYSEYAFFVNFRSIFLIFTTPCEWPRMLTNTYECLAIRSPRHHCKLVANYICRSLCNIFSHVWEQHRASIMLNVYLLSFVVMVSFYQYSATCNCSINPSETQTQNTTTSHNYYTDNNSSSFS